MKFVLVVLYAVILVASSQIISLEELLGAYATSSNIATNEIGNGGPSVQVANEALSIPMSQRSCTSDACNSFCRYLGYRGGSCSSPDSCHCYNY